LIFKLEVLKNMLDENFKKGKYYSLKELQEAGLEFYKKSSALIIYKKNGFIYWFDNVEKDGKIKLLSFYSENS